MKQKLIRFGTLKPRIKKLQAIIGVTSLLLLLSVSISTAGINLQQNSVTGTVLDDSGQPLPGVTVVEKGTTHGTVTDVDGVYTLSDISDGTTIVFSFVGMLSQEIVYTGQANIDVTLEMDAIGIEEVIAIGYGTVKKKDLTGSVASVASERLESRGSVDAVEALQGQLAGINVSRYRPC